MKLEEAYKILNLEEGASENDIKKSFRTLAAKNHPDTNKEDGAEEKFKKINEAYQILTGKQKAEDSFDNFYNVENINVDFMNSIFNDMFNKDRDLELQVSDLNINLQLSFKESIFGVNKKFSYHIKIYCNKCNGSGTIINKKERCKSCKGKGTVSKTERIGVNFIRSINYTCSKCNGVGFKTNSCEECSGAGYERKKKTVTLNIPPLGSYPKKFFVKKKGNEYKNIIGNVIVSVFPNQKGKGEFEGMTINGRDIISINRIKLNKILFGGTEEIKTPHGVRNITIKKMTRVGDKITIKDCGVVSDGSKRFTNGDYIVVVDIEYPDKDKLNEELKVILEKLYD